MGVKFLDASQIVFGQVLPQRKQGIIMYIWTLEYQNLSLLFLFQVQDFLFQKKSGIFV